ncbi:MAG: YggT family protein [Bacillota bacterium]|nr:YggT family protein [Bacillota bacterium]
MTYIVYSILRLLELLLFVRAILSWFPNFSQGPIFSFVYFTTEPVLAPIRKLLMRIQTLRSMPLDFSIIVAYLIIEILLEVLSVY